jgi:hypothetical protein
MIRNKMGNFLFCFKHHEFEQNEENQLRHTLFYKIHEIDLTFKYLKGATHFVSSNKLVCKIPLEISKCELKGHLKFGNIDGESFRDIRAFSYIYTKSTVSFNPLVFTLSVMFSLSKL